MIIEHSAQTVTLCRRATAHYWRLLRSVMSSVLTASTNGVSVENVSITAAVVDPTQPDIVTPTPAPTSGLGDLAATATEAAKRKAAETAAEVIEINDHDSPPYTQQDPVKRARTEEEKKKKRIVIEYEATLAAQRRFVELVSEYSQDDEVSKEQYQELRLAYISDLGLLITILTAKWKNSIPK